jgi:hypothetical protein
MGKKPDPEKIYICAELFIAAGGLGVAQGTRMRGNSHPVRAYFGRWVEDGTPPSEWPKPRPVEYYEEPPRKGREIPVERQVRARESFICWVKGCQYSSTVGSYSIGAIGS